MLRRTGPIGAIVRLLLLTGQRRMEVGGMRWPEVDLDAGVWTIPPERHKSGRGHTVPLPANSRHHPGGVPRTWVKHYSRWRNRLQQLDEAKSRLDAQRHVTTGRLHDLRRRVATQMQAAGVHAPCRRRRTRAHPGRPVRGDGDLPSRPAGGGEAGSAGAVGTAAAEDGRRPPRGRHCLNGQRRR